MRETVCQCQQTTWAPRGGSTHGKCLDGSLSGGINHPLEQILSRGILLKIYPVILNQLLQISLRNIQGYQNILLREHKQWNPTLQTKGAIATWVTFDEPQRNYAEWKGACSKGYAAMFPFLWPSWEDKMMMEMMVARAQAGGGLMMDA